MTVLLFVLAAAVAVEANRWIQLDPLGTLPTPRDRSAVVWSDPAGGFYVFGGYGGAYQNSTDYRNDLWLFVPQANQWTELLPSGTLPAARHSHTMVSDGAGGFYVFGGFKYSLENMGILNDIWLYSRQANQWTELHPSGTLPPARYSHGMVWSDSADGFYIFGGSDYGETKNDVWLYSRQANQWTDLLPSGTLPAVRFRHGMVGSGSADRFYVSGGYYGGFDGSIPRYLSDIWQYIPQANKWAELIPTGTWPTGRVGHRVVWSDSADGFYIFGGSDVSETKNDVWLYSRQANQWIQLDPSGTSPTPRQNPTIVWSDSADGFYVFGGFDSWFRNDLWLYTRQVTSTSSRTTTLTSTTSSEVSKTSSTLTMSLPTAASTETNTTTTASSTTSVTTRTVTTTSSSTTTSSTVEQGQRFGERYLWQEEPTPLWLIVLSVILGILFFGCIMALLWRRKDLPIAKWCPKMTGSFGNIFGRVATQGASPSPTPSSFDGVAPSERKHIFLSGRFNADSKLTYFKTVRNWLRVKGAPVHMVDVGPAESFAGPTMDGLHDAALMVAFCTDDYGAMTGAGYETYEELKRAHQRKIPILAVQMSRTFPPQPKDNREGCVQNGYVLTPDIIRLQDIDAKEPNRVAQEIFQAWKSRFDPTRSEKE